MDQPPFTPRIAVTLLCAWQWGQGTGSGTKAILLEVSRVSHPVLPLRNSHHYWNNFLLFSLELQSHTLKTPGNWHVGFLLKWQRCVAVGGGGGGMVTAPIHLRHFPAVWKCQLSIVRYWDFKRKAGNETVWNLPLFLNTGKSLKNVKNSVGGRRCICSWNVLFRLPLFDLSRCKVPQAAGITLALFIIGTVCY